MILAMISEITNLDWMFQQIRALHKKTFGARQVKVTEKTASTAYYLQLLKRKKDKDFILDEFIRLNKLSMPKKKDTLRYAQVRNKYWQRLRKRMKKAETILNASVREKK